MVFFSKKESLLKVFFQVQKWSYFGLIFLKLGLPKKLGTLPMVADAEITHARSMTETMYLK